MPTNDAGLVARRARRPASCPSALTTGDALWTSGALKLVLRAPPASCGRRASTPPPPPRPPGPNGPACAWTSSTLEPSASMPRLHRLLGPVADRDEDDHRGDADRHAEDRQPRAQLVGGDAAERDPQRLGGVTRRPPTRSRGSARRRAGSPARARAATSASWVISTTVRPCALRRSKISSTSRGRVRVEVARRLVGEHQRRVGDDRPRDRRRAAAGRPRARRAGGAGGRPCPPRPAPPTRAAGARRRGRPA